MRKLLFLAVGLFAMAMSVEAKEPLKPIKSGEL
jgi:hypothetical protein